MRAPGDPPPKPEVGPTIEAPARPAHGSHKNSRPHGSEPFSAPTFDPPSDPGELGTLGPYRVVRELGHGGMGAVYLAIDTRLSRKLALKVMLPRFAAQPTSKERFLREARAAAQIAHDNVVIVYEADERNGMPYIAMQFLKGASLEDYLQEKGELPITQVLRIGREAASGLAAAHKIGLVHRDIKPANLWLEAPNGRVKVLDFGLAKPLDTDLELTTGGMIIGTPVFMSPEQARGKDVGVRSDLFSLGGVLYRLCSGKLPFEGDTTMALLMALGTEEPRPLREVNPTVPEPLEQLIHQMLSKNADLRPQSADEVVKRIRAISEGMAASRMSVPEGAGPNDHGALHVKSDLMMVSGAEATPSDVELEAARIRRARRKTWTWVGGGAAAVVAMVLGAGIFLLKGGERKNSEIGNGAVFNRNELAKSDTIAGREPDTKPKPDTMPATRKAVAEVVSPPQASLVPTTKPVESPAAVPQTKPAQFARALPQVSPPTVVVDNDRLAADWVVSLGGTVVVPGNRSFTTAADLPRGPINVIHVNLMNKRMVDADLARFKDLKQLVTLRMDNAGITDRGLAYLSNVTTLQGLYVPGNPGVTDAGLDQLKGLKGLRVLWLGRTSVTDSGVARLKNFEFLMNLGLGGLPLSDSSMAQIGKLKGLTALYLPGVKVSDTGVSYLKELNNLAVLNINDTPLTDVGLNHLKAFRSLRSLNVERTKVTAKALADFHAAVPECEIYRDGGKTAAAPSIAEILTSPDYQWTEPRGVGSAISIGKSQADPYITADGLELWFTASTRDAGDIYFSRRKSIDGPWGAPTNAGPVINTEGWESMPLVTADGLTIVFWRSAAGAPYRVFESNRTDRNSPWGVPVQLNVADNAISPLLSADGLELFMSFAGKINRSTRASHADAWSKPVPVNELNGQATLEARWLSADNRSLLGSSRVNNGRHEYWLAQRNARGQPWGVRKRLDLADQVNEILYPFLRATGDGLELYYVLPRDNRIHVVKRIPKPAIIPAK